MRKLGLEIDVLEDDGTKVRRIAAWVDLIDFPEELSLEQAKFAIETNYPRLIIVEMEET